MNKSPPPIQAALAAALLNDHHCLVFIMSPLQGFRMVGGTIRRFRCATPPVIHHAAASAAILLNQNNLLSQNKNSTDRLLLPFQGGR
jgi:hypothetical protein